MRPAYFTIAAAALATVAMVLGMSNAVDDATAIEALLGSIVLGILGLRE